MDKCVIFCAGEFGGLMEPLTAADFTIAADGGLAHMQQLRLQPDEILGDFDSLGYVPGGAAVFPVEKDDTDAMLAVRRGLERGCREFVLYGSLDGPRLDHTLANLQVLQFLADREAIGYLAGVRYAVTAVKNGAIRFNAQAAGTVSVFCMGTDARGVTIRGLKYELEDGTLTAGFPLGVSNSFMGRESEIRVREGTLLVLWDRENGFPVRAE